LQINDIFSQVHNYGGPGIFVSLILEFVGLPFPGEPAMSLMGYLSGLKGYTAIIISTIYAILGANLGSILAYVIGNKFGDRVLVKLGKYAFITKSKMDKTGDWFRKARIPLMLFGKYMPGVRHVVPYLAGITKVSAREFFIYNGIGSVVWCITFVMLGAVLGKKWNVAEHAISTYVLWITSICVGVIILLKLIFMIRTKLKKAQEQ